MHGFDHFLITRFNLRSAKSGWNKDKRNVSTLSDDWMEHRIALFQKYCFPSIIKQSNKNFIWLIYLDVTTAKPHRQQLEKLTNIQHPEIKLIYVDGYDKFLEQHPKDVLAFRQKINDYIITSRVDNDDLLHEDYIARVQNEFKNQSFMAVNFIKTYNYQTFPPHKLFVNIRFSNQFISLIEKISGSLPRTCYSRGDRFWNRKGEIIQIHRGVYCMEIIHEKNLLNDLSGFPVFFEKPLAQFHLDTKARTKTITDFLKLWKMPWKKYLFFLIKYHHF